MLERKIRNQFIFKNEMSGLLKEVMNKSIDKRYITRILDKRGTNC